MSEDLPCYEGFAEMYDALMADTPYEIWAAYIDGLLTEWFRGQTSPHSPKKPLILDLACGTGNITLKLAEMGYDLIGMDASADMLAEAQRKAFEQGAQILFLSQDMRELNLYGTVDAAICICDGLNYILDENELLSVFKKVKLFLNPGGVFIFDMNTEYKFNEMFGDKILEGTGANGEAYEWQNVYDAKTKINEYHITFFSQNGKGEAFSELHRQRAYSSADICNMLLTAGFASVAMRDGYSSNLPRPESERILFIATIMG